MENGMKKVCVLILNYMTFQLTIQMVKHIRALGFDEDIVIVDNNSANESYFELEKMKSKYNFVLAKSQLNAGYACGNNIGLKVAVEMGYESVLIANNDIIFKDISSIYLMYELLESNKNIGCVSPRIYDKNNNEVEQFVYRPSIYDWSFGIFSYKKRCMFITKTTSENMAIYRPQGCCMLIATKMIQTVDYLDERTFLYFEEEILAEKMMKCGFLCYCSIDASVIHNHSVTIQKCLKQLEKLKIYLKSANIYMNYYRNWNVVARTLCSFVKGLSLIIK